MRSSVSTGGFQLRTASAAGMRQGSRKGVRSRGNHCTHSLRMSGKYRACPMMRINAPARATLMPVFRSYCQNIYKIRTGRTGAMLIRVSQRAAARIDPKNNCSIGCSSPREKTITQINMQTISPCDAAML